MGIPLVALQSNAPELAKQVGQVVPRQLSLRKALDEQRAAQQTMQMNDLKIAEAQRAQNEQQALQKAYTEADGDIDKFMQIAPARGVSPQTLIKLQDSIIQYKQSKLALDHAEWTAEQEKNKDISQALDAVMAVPEEVRPAAWDRAVQGLQAKGRLAPEEVQQFSQYPGADVVKQLSMSRKTSEQINQQIDNERAVAVEERAAAKQKWDAAEQAWKEKYGIMGTPSAEQRDFYQRYQNWLAVNKREHSPEAQAEFQKIYDTEQARLRREGSAAGTVDRYPPIIKDEQGRILGVYDRLQNTFVPAAPGAAGGRTTGLSETALSERASGATLATDLTDIEKRAAERKDIFGPVAGRVKSVQSWLTGGDPEAAYLQSEIASAYNRMIYFLSGKQINEAESKRLQESEPWSTNLPYDTFVARVNRLKKLMSDIYLRRTGKKLDFDDPSALEKFSGAVPDKATNSPSGTKRIITLSNGKTITLGGQ